MNSTRAITEHEPSVGGGSAESLSGTGLAPLLGQQEKEKGMIASIQILLGLLIGLVGFRVVGENPITGFSALFMSGFLLLTAVDRISEMRHREMEH